MFSFLTAILVACLASFRAIFTQQDRSQRIPEVKGTSGRTPLNGNKTKSSLALRFMETTSPIINSSIKSSRDVKEGSESSKNLTTLSEAVHVRRDFDVESNVESPHEGV